MTKLSGQYVRLEAPEFCVGWSSKFLPLTCRWEHGTQWIIFHGKKGRKSFHRWDDPWWSPVKPPFRAEFPMAMMLPDAHLRPDGPRNADSKDPSSVARTKASRASLRRRFTDSSCGTVPGRFSVEVPTMDWGISPPNIWLYMVQYTSILNCRVLKLP